MNAKAKMIGSFCALLAAPLTVWSATITVTPSASVIAEGGTVTVTVDVVPSTYVQSVTLTFQGESGQQDDTAAPYIFNHTCATPVDNQLITATVAFNNGSPSDQGTAMINVVGLSLTGNSTPLRGWPTAYNAESNPTGKPISQFNWSYAASGHTNEYTDPDSDDNNKSTWSGSMVVDGTLNCSATISGVNVSKNLTIIITRRTWPVPITCAQDHESDWGETPTVNDAVFGECRDRDSDDGGIFFVPQNNGSWASARTLSKVTTGPCTDWWYVSSSTLKCQRETVINKTIKSGGGTVGGENFYDANNARDCFMPSGSAGFLQAVKNHEYRGTPDTYMSTYGHHGRTEYMIRTPGIFKDAKQAIEELTNRVKNTLIIDIDATIQSHEYAISLFVSNEFDFGSVGPNWGLGPNALGAGRNARWDGSSWTDCDYGPDNF